MSIMAQLSCAAFRIVNGRNGPDNFLNGPEELESEIDAVAIDAAGAATEADRLHSCGDFTSVRSPSASAKPLSQACINVENAEVNQIKPGIDRERPL